MRCCVGRHAHAQAQAQTHTGPSTHTDTPRSYVHALTERRSCRRFCCHRTHSHPLWPAAAFAYHRTHTMHVTRKYINGNGCTPNKPKTRTAAQLVMTVYGCTYDAHSAQRDAVRLRAHACIIVYSCTQTEKPNSHDVFEPASARTAYNSLPAGASPLLVIL